MTSDSKVLDLRKEADEFIAAGSANLATLRLAGISYVAWDAKKGEIAGTGRSFDPATGTEHEFTVMGDGEPVLTASDLEEFEGRYGTAEGLIGGIR